MKKRGRLEETEFEMRKKSIKFVVATFGMCFGLAAIGTAVILYCMSLM